MNYPTLAQIHSILKQMKENGTKLEDYESEYFHGEHRTYYFDKEKQEFIFARMDVIAASYFDEIILMHEGMIEALSKYSLFDFKESGFEI